MFSREGFEDSSYWALQRPGFGNVIARWRYDDGRCRIEFHDFKSTIDREARQWGAAVPEDGAFDEAFEQFVAAVAPFAVLQQVGDVPAGARRDVTVCRLVSLPADCDPYLLHHGKGRTSHVHFFVDRQDERRILVASATEVYGGMKGARLLQAERDEWGGWTQVAVDPDMADEYARFASPWGREAVDRLEREAPMGMGM